LFHHLAAVTAAEQFAPSTAVTAADEVAPSIVFKVICCHCHSAKALQPSLFVAPHNMVCDMVLFMS
jgi:hypothetical protein